MSKDPAFLFYDGDAARDVSHMNRLERGAYFDIIQAQRKFGDLTLDQIKKILGKDFDVCWPSIELIMTKNEGAYYLYWVKESVLRRLRHCEQQTQRVMKRWAIYHGNTTVIPRIYLKENENEKKGGVEGNKIDISKREEIFRSQVFAQTGYPPDMLQTFFNYWSEPDRGRKRMRFEKQETWDLKRRLDYWQSRDNSFGKPKPQRTTYEHERNAPGKYDNLSRSTETP